MHMRENLTESEHNVYHCKKSLVHVAVKIRFSASFLRCDGVHGEGGGLHHFMLKEWDVQLLQGVQSVLFSLLSSLFIFLQPENFLVGAFITHCKCVTLGQYEYSWLRHGLSCSGDAKLYFLTLIICHFSLQYHNAEDEKMPMMCYHLRSCVPKLVKRSNSKHPPFCKCGKSVFQVWVPTGEEQLYRPQVGFYSTQFLIFLSSSQFWVLGFYSTQFLTFLSSSQLWFWGFYSTKLLIFLSSSQIGQQPDWLCISKVYQTYIF